MYDCRIIQLTMPYRLPERSFTPSPRLHQTMALAFWRSRLNRVAVSSGPKKDVDATIDFLETVTIGHWLGCACSILGLTALGGTITIPENVAQGGTNAKRTYIRILA